MKERMVKKKEKTTFSEKKEVAYDETNKDKLGK